jgi:hypothetical protein
MFAIRHIVIFALLLVIALALTLLVISGGRLQHERVKLSFQKDIEVAPNLPASLSNAVLHVSCSDSLDGNWSGSRSLNSPMGSVSSVVGTNETWNEDRLIAINAEGFKMLFTKRWRYTGLGQSLYQETNVILFRYGQITETNTLGRRIVGHFK